MVSREITRPSVYHNGTRADKTKSRYLTPHRYIYPARVPCVRLPFLPLIVICERSEREISKLSNPHRGVKMIYGIISLLFPQKILV